MYPLTQTDSLDEYSELDWTLYPFIQIQSISIGLTDTDFMFCSLRTLLLTFHLFSLQNFPEASLPNSPLHQRLNITTSFCHAPYPRLRAEFSSDDGAAFPIQSGVCYNIVLHFNLILEHFGSINLPVFAGRRCD